MVPDAGVGTFASLVGKVAEMLLTPYRWGPRDPSGTISNSEK